jgi:membrane-bound metal-dependent hydrolase YbcI (DUF457 family)
MFLGHFAVAFAAKKADKSISLGTSIFAAQWLDLLWPILLLTGTETVTIAPQGSVIPLAFTHYPVSHSLMAVACWSVLFGLLYYTLTKNKKASLVIGLLVLSHWALDFLAHIPDLPLVPNSDFKAGVGLWNFKLLELTLELTLFFSAVLLYFKNNILNSKKENIITWSLIVFLALIHLMNSFGPAPEGIKPLAIFALTQWILVPWGYWADKNNVSKKMRTNLS